MGGRVALVAFDLDGTLLSSAGVLDGATRCGLEELGLAGVVRVLATGRSLAALRRVVALDAPVDYVIFSSGCGVLRWGGGELLLRRRLSRLRAWRLGEYLMGAGISFMAQGLLPDNHRLYYWRGENAGATDFEERVAYHASVAEALDVWELRGLGVSQFVVPMPCGTPPRGGVVDGLWEHGDVVRATSPFDGRSVWFEVFARGVSKGTTLGWLCRRLGVGLDRVAAVGNDYNDESMLGSVGYPFVVANAPVSLRERYVVVPPNTAGGCCWVMDWVLGRRDWPVYHIACGAR